MTDAARSRQPGTARSLLAALVEAYDRANDPGDGDNTIDAFENAVATARAFLAQPDGPQEIDVERLARAIDVVTASDYDLPVFRGTHVLAQAVAAAYRAQQPEGGAEGEGRA